MFLLIQFLVDLEVLMLNIQTTFFFLHENDFYSTCIWQTMMMNWWCCWCFRMPKVSTIIISSTMRKIILIINEWQSIVFSLSFRFLPIQSFNTVKAFRKSFRSVSVVSAAYNNCSRAGALLFNNSSNVIRWTIY